MLYYLRDKFIFMVCTVYTSVELGADSNQFISYVLILSYRQHRRRHNYYLYYLETTSVGSILASEYYIISPSWASEENNAGGACYPESEA